jgi:hypothetical protein
METSICRLIYGMERGTVSSCWETPSWELSLSLAPTLTCDWDRAQVSLQSYWVRNLEWMSRRSRSGGHKTWCSSIKHIIFSNVIKCHTKTTLGMCQVEDQVCPDFTRRVPTWPSVCFLVPLFKSVSPILQSTCCCSRTSRLPSKIWELRCWSREVCQNLMSW